MKTKKSRIIFLIIAFGFVGVITILANTFSSKSSEEGATTATDYTLTEVTAHSDSVSCWTIIRGNVYDLTSWIKGHPGGAEAILATCGKDATAQFESQHGGQENPENALQSFKIGIYKSN